MACLLCNAIDIVTLVCLLSVCKLLLNRRHILESEKRRCICWFYWWISIKRVSYPRHQSSSPNFSFVSAVLGQRLLGFSRNKTIFCDKGTNHRNRGARCEVTLTCRHIWIRGATHNHRSQSSAPPRSVFYSVSDAPLHTVTRCHCSLIPAKREEENGDQLSLVFDPPAPISSHKRLSPAEHLFVTASKHWAIFEKSKDSFSILTSNCMSSSALPPPDPVLIYEPNHSDSCYSSRLSPFGKILWHARYHSISFSPSNGRWTGSAPLFKLLSLRHGVMKGGFLWRYTATYCLLCPPLLSTTMSI